jgi:hypothetical protein
MPGVGSRILVELVLCLESVPGFSPSKSASSCSFLALGCIAYFALSVWDLDCFSANGDAGNAALAGNRNDK